MKIIEMKKKKKEKTLNDDIIRGLIDIIQGKIKEI